MSGIVRVCSLLAAMALLAGCMMTTGGAVITGSGRTVTQEYDFSDFTRVSVSNAFRVTIDRGERHAVAVSVDDNLTDYLDVRLEGDTLYIGMKPSLHLGFRNATQRAEITMPSVEGIELSGATQGDISGISGDERLEIEVSGASRLRGDVTAGGMRMEISGASTVEIIGSATDLDVEASGASNAKLGEFESGDTRAEASGASHVTVRPSGRLTGAASGASTVTYLGNPESVQVDTSGASNVRRG